MPYIPIRKTQPQTWQRSFSTTHRWTGLFNPFLTVITGSTDQSTPDLDTISAASGLVEAATTWACHPWCAQCRWAELFMQHKMRMHGEHEWSIYISWYKHTHYLWHVYIYICVSYDLLQYVITNICKICTYMVGSHHQSSKNSLVVHIQKAQLVTGPWWGAATKGCSPWPLPYPQKLMV